MINTLVIFIALILIWMLVTITTDWQAVFYRKHIVYMRRMKNDLVKGGEPNRGISGSFVSQHSVTQETSRFQD